MGKHKKPKRKYDVNIILNIVLTILNIILTIIK